MRTTVFGLLLLTIVLPSIAEDRLPRDVRRFVERREGCDHMRGEIPAPREKRHLPELLRETQRLCMGTDVQLAQLKKKYQENSSVMQLLGEFEPDIEAGAATRTSR